MHERADGVSRPMQRCESPADLRPGDIGFGPIRGGAGLLVNAGQLLLGEGFHVGELDIRHVFVVVNSPLIDPHPMRTTMWSYQDAPRAVEAMPSGARLADISNRWTGEYAYVRLPEDYPRQADDAAAIARAMIGTPYSFASYVALAAWRLGVKTPRLEKWIDRRKSAIDIPSSHPVLMPRREPIEVALPCEAICSVLADQAWSLTGKKIMHGVAHQCVTPGALAGRLLGFPGAVWSIPEED